MTLPASGLLSELERVPGNAGFIILKWLLWPERVIARAHHRSMTAAGDRSFGLDSVAFRNRLEPLLRDVRADDIEAACRQLAEQCERRQGSGLPILPWLYRKCLADFVVDIDFYGGLPTVSHAKGRFTDWLALTDDADPDTLACLVFAERAHAAHSLGEAESLVRTWPLTIGSGDRDLAHLARQGLSDLHIHFTSLWPVSLSWQRVLRFSENGTEGKSLSQVRAFGPQGREHEGAEYRCLENATGQGAGRPVRLPRLLSLRPPFVPFFDGSTPAMPNPIADILSSERIMLLRAWHALMGSAAGPGTVGGSPIDARATGALEAELDEYIVAKSIFRSRHARTVNETNKGLSAFDEIRRNNAHLGSFAREELRDGTFSGTRFRKNKAFLVLALQNIPSLREAEVRIAPPSVKPTNLVRSYAKTMMASHSLLQGLKQRRNDVDIRIAVHFKRALSEKPQLAKRDRQAGRPATMPFLRKLLEFDRETASFQDYRFRAARAAALCPPGHRSLEDAEASRHFSRVDLASPERGAGSWSIAPYVRLLRGDAEALRTLLLPGASTYFPKWCALARQGRVHLPLREHALRVTCHAGEDFFTLIDGLRHIDSAITDWRMSQGDALGHCLALGLPAARYISDHARVWAPTGVELDAFVWLRRLLRTEGLGDSRVCHDLDDHIRTVAWSVYGASLPVRTAGDIVLDLDNKIASAAQPLIVSDCLAPHNLPISRNRLIDGGTSGGEVLRLLDLFDAGVASRRAVLKAPDRLHERLVPIVEEVQKLLIDRISRAGITIETNPSSNMRMSRIGRPHELPIWNVVRHCSPSPPITICTDNPGIYDTNVENEYAVMHSALLQAPWKDEVPDPLARLEEMRRSGRRLFSDLS